MVTKNFLQCCKHDNPWYNQNKCRLLVTKLYTTKTNFLTHPCIKINAYILLWNTQVKISIYFSLTQFPFYILGSWPCVKLFKHMWLISVFQIPYVLVNCMSHRSTHLFTERNILTQYLHKIIPHIKNYLFGMIHPMSLDQSWWVTLQHLHLSACQPATNGPPTLTMVWHNIKHSDQYMCSSLLVGGKRERERERVINANS